MKHIRKIKTGAIVLLPALAVVLLMLSLGSCKWLLDALKPTIELSGTQSTSISLTPANLYKVTGTWAIKAPVQVDPGVTITMTADSKITVTDGGSLSAIGSADDPIIIKGEQSTAGYWGYILFRTDNIDNKLQYVQISDGGGDSSYDSIVYQWGGRLKISNTLIKNSQRNGFLVYADSFLDEFRDNEIQDCLQAPLSILAANMKDIDSLSQFSGNTTNRIVVRSSSTPIGGPAHTWPKTTVPFLFSGSVDIRNAVIVEPGARFEFASGRYLGMTTGGSLKAIGTAGERISFTGAQQTKGFWKYILIRSDNVDNVFQYVDVSYGGGDSSYDGAIYVWDARFTLGNSSVTNSQRYGVRLYGTNNFTNDGNNVFSGNTSGNIFP